MADFLRFCCNMGVLSAAFCGKLVAECPDLKQLIAGTGGAVEDGERGGAGGGVIPSRVLSEILNEVSRVVEDPGERALLLLMATKPMQLAQYFCTGQWGSSGVDDAAGGGGGGGGGDCNGHAGLIGSAAGNSRGAPGVGVPKGSKGEANGAIAAAASDAEWTSHYGLALDFYTHFTSPIRRYADVIVHRQLAAALAAEERLIARMGMKSSEGQEGQEGETKERVPQVMLGC
ncbi:hypothetical protein CLOM_g23561 [Closterium sp. NIES-68]|nr:hypothetical protein CLOM_g23561 [Closterium sp. NIES-68]